MSISLYSASVPVLVHYLERLHAALEVARLSAKSEQAVLGARLAEGMFPFAQQVGTACGFAFRICCPLLQIDTPALVDRLDEPDDHRSVTHRALDWRTNGGFRFTLPTLRSSAFRDRPGELPVGDGKSFAGLQERVAGTLHFLGTIREEDMAAADTLTITTTAGFAERTFSAPDYVLHYAMPNFFFHLTMAYAILRAQGVPVGKQDFDGYHEYPAGFRFPDPA